jgi:hypothetical protein
MAILRILKRNGEVIDALIDDEDWDDLSRFHWHMAGGKGRVGKYVTRSDGVYLHRLVAHRAGLLSSLDKEPGARGRWTESIDHINGDKLDNRKANLRVADRKEQMTNRANPLTVKNTSGHRGVSFTKARSHLPEPWYAFGTVGNKTLPLGTFATKDEAVAARLAWEETGIVPPPSGRTRPDNTSGVRGVYRQGGSQKPWLARVMVDKKYVYLGYYATVEEAAAARRAWDESK